MGALNKAQGGGYGRIMLVCQPVTVFLIYPVEIPSRVSDNVSTIQTGALSPMEDWALFIIPDNVY